MVVAAVEDDDGDDPDASVSTTANPLLGTALASRGAESGRANAEDV